MTPSLGNRSSFTDSTRLARRRDSSLHLVVSSPEHTNADVFVQVEKLSPSKQPQAVQTIRPGSAVVQRLFKFMHDWDVIPGSAGMAFHRGPDGCLRSSFALNKDGKRSRVARPFYTYAEKVPLRKGEARVLEIPLRPYGMYWEVSLCLSDASRPSVEY